MLLQLPGKLGLSIEPDHHLVASMTQSIDVREAAEMGRGERIGGSKH